MEFETLKRNYLKRNIMIGVAVVLIISAVVLTFTRAKYRVTQSIPLVNGTINYSPFDIKVTSYYQNELLDTFPEQGTVSFKSITCDKNATATFDESNWKIVVTNLTEKGTHCNIYFDEKVPASETIEELLPDNPTMLAYDDYGNLRYIGADPNNYVSFNDELWRIIGVFSVDTHGLNGQKLIKIIRNNSLGNIDWSSDYRNGDWTTSSLQITLNSDYLNGTGSYTSTGIKNNIARNMIETVTWKIGGAPEVTQVKASKWYEFERGTRVYNSSTSKRSATWSGKIGLMYPSDYLYATSGGTKTNRNACLALQQSDWDLSYSTYSDCLNNDWLYTSIERWTITPETTRDVAYLVCDDLYVISSDDTGDAHEVKPSLYLKSSVTFTGGNGTSSNPYTLDLLEGA